MLAQHSGENETSGHAHTVHAFSVGLSIKTSKIWRSGRLRAAHYGVTGGTMTIVTRSPCFACMDALAARSALIASGFRSSTASKSGVVPYGSSRRSTKHVRLE